MSELALPRSKTTIGEAAAGANITAPRVVKNAFAAEGEEKNTALKSAVFSMVQRPQARQDKVMPKGRNLLSR